MEIKRPIKPQSVIDRYSARHGGPVHLREILALALREGSIRGRAFYQTIVTADHISSAWDEFKTPTARKTYTAKHVVARSAWWRSASWANDILGWDFAKSRVHVTVSTNPSKFLLLKHFRFYEDEIIKVLGRSSLEIKDLDFSKVAKKDEWRRFWHEIILRLAEKDLDLKSSFLGTGASDEKIAGSLIHIFDVEDAENPTIDVYDDELALRFRARHGHRLSYDTVREEIRNLRQTLQLKRSYVRRKPG